jgi:BclB C-terminal domain-containing protein
VADGLVGLPAFVGFGSSAQGVDVLASTIDLTGAPTDDLNYAFTVPRDGLITSLTAFFSVTAAVGVGVGDYQIHAQLYISQAPDSNIFDAIAATDIALTPAFPGLGIALGDIATGSVAVNIAVSAGDRLLLVFYVEPPALSVAATVAGYASAGLAIS